MNKRLMHAAIIGSLITVPQAHAIEFDGFATMGVTMNDQKNEVVYLDSINNNAGFLNDSKFGLQMTAEVAGNMDLVAQLLARGTQDDFNLVTSWAYLDYTLNNNFKIRAGKMKEPVYLISDYYEVSYAYPWIRPPQEVYINNPVRTLNGLIFQYMASAGGVNFLVQPYFGTNSEPIPGTNGAARFQAEDYVGLALSMSNNAFTFQVSSFSTDVTTEGMMPMVGDQLDCITSPGTCTPGQDGLIDPPFGTNGLDPAAPGGSYGNMTLLNVAGTGSASLTNVGLSWDIANFVGYAEYVTRDITDQLELMFPDQDAYYVTLGYRFGKFMPHVTVAHSEAKPLTPNPSQPITYFASMVAIDQDTVTLGFRYEINDSAAFKFELSQITIDELSSGNGLYNDSTTSFGIMPDLESNTISMSVDVIF